MPRSPLATLALGFALFPSAACHEHHEHPAPVATPRPVSILVEVYDPATNFVWENVGVRVVQARQEWSACTCVNPLVEYFLTGHDGTVLIDEHLLAASQVGFVTDGAGRAMLGPGASEDEATVQLEISAEGFTTVVVEVALSWSTPDVMLSVPFH